MTEELGAGFYLKKRTKETPVKIENDERNARNARAAESTALSAIAQLEIALTIFPEKLQLLLSKVFDFGDTEKRIRQLTALAGAALATLQNVQEETRALITEMNRAIDALDKRLGACEVIMEGR